MPAAANRLTSVQPSLARTSRPLRSRSAASSGCVSPGGAGGATSTTVTVSPSSRYGASTVFDVRQRLLRGPVGSEAVVERHDRPSGTTLPATPPSTNTACSASRYWQPSITGAGSS